MARDRKTRKEELLAAARGRLVDDQEAQAAPREIRYRGQVMRQGSSRTPGSASSAPRSAADSKDVRAALQKVKDLYHDGLISRAEAEKKRSEILDRL